MTGAPSIVRADAQAAWRERVVEFDCRGARLLGVMTMPLGVDPQRLAVLIAVGGPQYRVGSHRQFVLLARRLAAAGFASLRFDYRGMGDSEGAPRPFDAVADDMRAAIDAACSQAATDRLMVFGLCDAASSALMYATADRRVRALTLINPWLRSGDSLAATHIKHYYGARLMQGEFWRKILAGKLDWRASLRSALGDAGAMLRGRHRRRAAATGASFQSQMAAGLRRFPGRVLLILSGKDLTAQEFAEYTLGAADWKGLLVADRIERFDLPEADHTFSNAVWRAAIEDKMLAWLGSI